MTGRTTHGSCVDAWLERTKAQGLPRDELLALFESALGALWARTSTTLGEVTLTAIADRVLHNAAEQFPAFASLHVERNGRLQALALRENVDGLHHTRLVEGMRYVLVEFFTVLGNLTAEILTPELHATLGKVVPVSERTLRGPVRARRGRST